MTVTRFPRAPAAAAPATDASFVVNTLTGCTVSVAPLIAKAIGLYGDENASKALDAAMPAMNQVRRFASKGPTAEHELDTLVFWGQLGSVRARCRLEHVAGQTAEPLVRVTVLNAAELIMQHTKTDRALNEPDGAQTRMDHFERHASDLDTFRDDRAILQLIARRIEDGVKLTAVSQSPERLNPYDWDTNVSSNSAAVSAQANTEYEKTHQTSSVKPTDVPEPAIFEANDNSTLKLDATADELNPDANTSDVEASASREQDLEATLDQSELAALFARTAHDIKTPLSAISAASEIIRDERLGPSGNERYRAYAADIHASARHALAIVDRLMKMPPALEGQPHPARATPEPDPIVSVDLNALISGCVAELRPLMDAQNLALTMRLDASGPRALTDALGLKQSLLNVLTNAMKFTPPGGTIHIETETLLARGARVSVRDTGRGMTKGAIARQLDMDAGLPAPTATGLGLGLPQVKAFARTTGAALGIDSTLGRGTTVSLTFAN